MIMRYVAICTVTFLAALALEGTSAQPDKLVALANEVIE